VVLAPFAVGAIVVGTAVSAWAASPTVVDSAPPVLLDDSGQHGQGGPGFGGGNTAQPGSPVDAPSYWNGGDPAGGTGSAPGSSGPDTGTGPGYFSGGDPAGAS
jgi:hypothetical protein